MQKNIFSMWSIFLFISICLYIVYKEHCRIKHQSWFNWEQRQSR